MIDIVTFLFRLFGISFVFGVVIGLFLLILLIGALILDFIGSLILAPLYLTYTKLLLLDCINVKLDANLFADIKRGYLRAAYIILRVLKYQCEEYLKHGPLPKLTCFYPFPGPTPFDEIISRIKTAVRLKTIDKRVKVNLAKWLNKIYTEKEVAEYVQQKFTFPIEIENFEIGEFFQYQFLPFHIPALLNIDTIKVGDFIDTMLENNFVYQQQLIALRDSLEPNLVTKLYINELVYYIFGYTIGDFLMPYMYQYVITKQLIVFDEFNNKYFDSVKSMITQSSIESLLTINKQLEHLQTKNPFHYFSEIYSKLNKINDQLKHIKTLHDSLSEVDRLVYIETIEKYIKPQVIHEQLLEKIKERQKIWYNAVRVDELKHDLEQLQTQLPQLPSEITFTKETVPFIVFNPWELILVGIRGGLYTEPVYKF